RIFPRPTNSYRGTEEIKTINFVGRKIGANRILQSIRLAILKSLAMLCVHAPRRSPSRHAAARAARPSAQD
ncbi:MAG TPA: hypothetical protein PLA28_05440, partial [Ottowia sp.]|nr:hypothetical protein [Ottowia sp.]